MTIASFGANAFFDSFKLRGFDAPRYLDGLRLPADATTFAVPRIETYGLERIEVLKGPSAALYGQSEPGGLLNMVSKRPTVTPQYEIDGSFGSFERFQGAFDIGGPIDKNGEFLYRIVGLGRDSNTQTDFVQDNKLFIAPSFTWRPTHGHHLHHSLAVSEVENKGYQQYVTGQVSLSAKSQRTYPLLAAISASQGLMVTISSSSRLVMRSSTGSTIACSFGKTCATPKSATTSLPPAPRGW